MVDLEEMKEKSVKVIEKYPNPKEYMIKMMIAGGTVGASGKYNETELIDINIKTLEMLKNIDTITDISEVMLLLEGRGAEFVNDAYDLILSGKIDDVNDLSDVLET